MICASPSFRLLCGVSVDRMTVLQLLIDPYGKMKSWKATLNPQAMLASRLLLVIVSSDLFVLGFRSVIHTIVS